MLVEINRTDFRIAQSIYIIPDIEAIFSFAENGGIAQESLTVTVAYGTL